MKHHYLSLVLIFIFLGAGVSIPALVPQLRDLGLVTNTFTFCGPTLDPSLRISSGAFTLGVTSPGGASCLAEGDPTKKNSRPKAAAD